MIEMDRFVHNLQGNESEVIERESTQSAATMKDQGSSLIEYITFILEVKLDINKYLNFSLMNSIDSTIPIQNRADAPTWVGFPHNMLLPRYFRNIK